MKHSRRTRIAGVLIAVALLLVPVGVAYGQDGHGTDKPHWSYDGEDGPYYWGNLEGYGLCTTGSTQSPINISGDIGPDEGSLVIDYNSSPLNIVNNGHTVQVDYAAGSSIVLDGKTFKLVQFHFHQGAENLIDGELFPMELHLVHEAEDGELAVIGVLFTVAGPDNAAFQTVWAHLPTLATERRTIEAVEINAADLLPASHSYFRFMGSLTTPPCTEGVNWVVMAEPVVISQAQYDAFNAIYNHNFRAERPVNDRVITFNG